MEIDLDTYFREQVKRPERYKGQLDGRFQDALSRYHARITEQDCKFYHTIDLGGHVHVGEWDLRGHESAYLGNHEIAGKRILEAGPASGFLSAYMAMSGAELVVLELPFGSGPELVPFSGIDMDAQAASGQRSMRLLRNSWWFTKRALGFKAQAVYADIYEPPCDIGRFDIVTFGSILLHLSHPFRALQKLSAHAAKTIIVTDVLSVPAASQQHNFSMIFAPTPFPSGIVHWWALSPEVIQHMLSQLGFSKTEVTLHSPVNMPSRPPMFTVVGHRS